MVFTNDERFAKLLELSKTSPGILGTTKAFTKACKCMNVDTAGEKSNAVPLVDVLYVVGELE